MGKTTLAVKDGAGAPQSLESWLNARGNLENVHRIAGGAPFGAVEEVMDLLPLKHNLEMFEVDSVTGATGHASKITFDGTNYLAYWTTGSPLIVYGASSPDLATWTDLNSGGAILSRDQTFEDAGYGVMGLVYARPATASGYVGFYQYQRTSDGKYWTATCASADGITWGSKAECTIDASAFGFAATAHKGISITDVVYDFENDRYIGLFHVILATTGVDVIMGAIGHSDNATDWTLDVVLPMAHDARKGSMPINDTDTHCLLRIGGAWVVLFQQHIHGGDAEGGWMIAPDPMGPWFVSPHRLFKKGTPGHGTENGRYPHAVVAYGKLTFVQMDGGNVVRVGQVDLDPPFVAKRVDYATSIASGAAVDNAGWIDFQGATKISIRVSASLPAGGTGTLDVALLATNDLSATADSAAYTTLSLSCGTSAAQAKTFAIEPGLKGCRFQLINNTSGAVTNTVIEVMME